MTSGDQEEADMRPPEIRPSGVERTFGAEEIIVSKTDTKGRITYANNVFLRVSQYSEEAVLGAPHSIIRHPEMPRGVFRLMWDTISAGREIFAYVNNLAADGAYYWVLAHVTPTFDAQRKITGYHSNRRSPESAAVRKADELYRQMIQVERRHQRPADAIEASCALLDQRLTDAGKTYEQWVWSLDASEGAR